ncbi:choline/ethanolaminephosphotransferase 1-like [Symsagittifera roscoffensis]|uniref:choline/ethanolaminephosphotransferase 1-like n=1 Tax=Symsagittifera roscoffensis TaxID=84072 RepID=UPI00307BA4A8
MKFHLFRYLLSPEDLLQFKTHQYDCRGKGCIEQYMDAFAARVVVPRIPKWVAPNMITLLGFIIHSIAAVNVILNDRASFAYLISEANSIFYMISLFIYGVLDSADGAQARRIGCSTPMGELFDHGMDAITMGLVVLSVCSLLRFSYFKVRLFMFCLGGNFLFFLTHWRSFTFGHLQFSKVDAVEGQFFVQFLFLMNVLLGFDFFWFELPTPSFIDEFLLRRMEVADVIFFALVVFCTINIVTQVYEICFVNGRITYAGLRTYSPLPWLLTVIVLAFVNYLLVSYFIYDYIPQFFTITVIAPLVKLSWTVIMCYMARCAVPAFDVCVIPSIVLLMWFIFLRNGLFMDYITRPNLVLNSLCTISILDFVYFAGSNLLLISRELGYPLLTVKNYYHQVTTLPM